MTEPPLFIHISPDWCGQQALANLFRQNGHAVALEEGGRLAEDILYAQATEGRALAPWSRVRLVTGLYRHSPFWLPPLEAWRSFDWLAARFPGARFILTTREVDGWLLDRMVRDARQVARCHAHHLGVAEAELPEIWEAQWKDHVAAVEAFFGNDPRLIRVNIDQDSIADLAARLSDLLPMGTLPPDRNWHPPYATPPENTLLTNLDTRITAIAGDRAYIDDVAGFCLQGLDAARDGDTPMSAYSCIWDGGDRITRGTGTPRDMAVLRRSDPPPVAISTQDRDFKHQRCEAVINDVLRTGHALPLRVDMEDLRWLGSAQGDVAHQPVICHNRRVGAQNVVLWPLPDLHSIGLPGFDPYAPPDQIPFEEKRDQIVWRGMISGSEMRDSVKPGPASHVFLDQLARAGRDPAAREEAWNGLKRTSRLNFILRHFDDKDFDLGIVMAWRYRDFATDPFLAPYCRPRETLNFFRGFRYQLYLSGYDHGSNFIPMIDSQSVLLKEEDGWEVFYSGRFKPWKHYIPLARYGADIKEKLAWARDNPLKCNEMSAASRAEVARLRDPATRRAILACILDGLAAAG